MTPAEEARLRALVYQCWEFKGTPWFPDALQAIVDWFERLPLTRLEEAQARAASLHRLLRRTDPELFRVRR